MSAGKAVKREKLLRKLAIKHGFCRPDTEPLPTALALINEAFEAGRSSLEFENAALKAQWNSALKGEDDALRGWRAAESEIARLREALNDEQKAHEKIARYLVPLVGTADGTSVSAAERAAAEIESLQARAALIGGTNG